MGGQKLNRRQRRDRRRAVIVQVLDGPSKKPTCGQAKAVARRRKQALTRSSSVPKSSAADKMAARERQAVTGEPYTQALQAVRAARAKLLPSLPETDHAK